MTRGQIIAQQHADSAVVKFVEEVASTGHIHEDIFDKTRDTTLECAKQNIEASSLSEREKKAAKECVHKAVHDIAQMFKDGMVKSGRIILKQ